MQWLVFGTEALQTRRRFCSVMLCIVCVIPSTTGWVLVRLCFPGVHYKLGHLIPHFYATQNHSENNFIWYAGSVASFVDTECRYANLKSLCEYFDLEQCCVYTKK